MKPWPDPKLVKAAARHEVLRMIAALPYRGSVDRDRLGPARPIAPAAQD
ncbi:hypothetical protein [Novosphingobium huizhouense]|nr:hypothetical protein [Novosphingobium huizhouense]